jgi:MOSC domain-containing protein YiiM
MTIQLLDIAFRTKPRGPMQTCQESVLTRVAGVSGDARGKPGKRQVTVLSIEQWQMACAELDVHLPWTIRRANLLIQGLILGPSLVGKQIKIGRLILLINGETDPCAKMDTQQPGLTQALTPHWRGGLCCTVICDGRISQGQSVTIAG